MERTEGHHLNILPVKCDPDVFPIGDRFDKALVELPRHVGNHDPRLGRDAVEHACSLWSAGLLSGHCFYASDFYRRSALNRSRTLIVPCLETFRTPIVKLLQCLVDRAVNLRQQYFSMSI